VGAVVVVLLWVVKESVLLVLVNVRMLVLDVELVTVELLELVVKLQVDVAVVPVEVLAVAVVAVAVFDVLVPDLVVQLVEAVDDVLELVKLVGVLEEAVVLEFEVLETVRVVVVVH